MFLIVKVKEINDAIGGEFEIAIIIQCTYALNTYKYIYINKVKMVIGA